MSSIEKAGRECVRCGKPFWGTEMIDAQGRTVDSEGGMKFTEGWVCDECLGESGGDLIERIRRELSSR